MSITAEPLIEVNPENEWRLGTPGAEGWERTARPGAQAKKKYFMVSCDTHLMPPPKLFAERIEPRFRDMLPKVEVRDGVRYLIQHGMARAEPLFEPELFGEDMTRTKAGAAFSIHQEYSPVEERVRDQDRDGVDGEVIFPNGPALLMWAGHDVEFILAQCRVWNDWAIEFCRPVLHRCSPVAAIPTADVDLAIAEVERVAKLGFKILSLPSKPIWGPDDPDHTNYQYPAYARLWSAIEDSGLPVVFHVASGKDPRSARGYGGAITNYVVHAMAPALEPLVSLCAAGVIERHPKLRFASIEANAGWLPWMLDSMDEAYRKHHFWIRPKLKELPSTYFRTNGMCSLGEDRPALLLAEEYGLQDNLMWANDFPHHEGTWPHSAEAIERNFGHLREQSRAKILGLNAARFFGFEIPEHLR
jgi:predicted TIM-barrel fold metal-dependent hydrolase